MSADRQARIDALAEHMRERLAPELPEAGFDGLLERVAHIAATVAVEWLEGGR